MANYLAPGVYVDEFEDSEKAIEGISTSIAGFIGLTQRGTSIGTPILLNSFAEYQRIFGGYLPSSFEEKRYLANSVEQFFNNGGSSVYVMRVVGKEDTCAIHDLDTDVKVHMEACNEGRWGNDLQVRIK